MFKVGDRVVICKVQDADRCRYKVGDMATVVEVFGEAWSWGEIKLKKNGKVVDVYWTEVEPTEKDFVEAILTDEEIQAIDDSTHFHESFDWSIRFARNVLKAAEEKRMAKVEFNINNYVEFELTEAGVERLYELDEKFIGYKWFTQKEYVVGQKMRMQLWSVMEKFGPVIGAGHLTFCKDCVITFETKENE